jgi:hypothetical protein
MRSSGPRSFTGHEWVPFDHTPSAEDVTGVGSDPRREVLDRVGENQPPTPGPAPAAGAALLVALAPAPVPRR